MRARLLLFTYLIVGVLIQLCASATTVTFKFKHTTSGNIQIYLPINNTYFWGNKREIASAANRVISTSLTDKETGFITIRYNTATTLFYIQKGENISITVDTTKNPTFYFEGTNADGLHLLQAFTQSENITSISAKLRKDTTASLLSKHMHEEKATIENQFTALYSNKKIDHPFLTAIQTNLDYLYAAAAASVLSDRCIRQTSLYKKTPKEHEQYWLLLFTEFDLNRKSAPTAPSYIELAKNYINYYLPFKRKQQNDTIALAPKQYKQREVKDIRKHITRNAVYIESWVLNLYYIQEHFEEELPTIFAGYKKTYPYSNYTKYIEPANQKVIQFYNATVRSFTDKEVFIKDYQSIHSFKELTEKLKGKMFYVDMWASWCGPCREEFRHKDELIAELTKNNIGILYLSLDFETSDKQWKNLIKYYKLSGLHIRANERLSKEISTMFGTGIGISIPRYLLINKDGKIIEKEAFRPSDKEKLLNQIRLHL